MLQSVIGISFFVFTNLLPVSHNCLELKDCPGQLNPKNDSNLFKQVMSDYYCKPSGSDFFGLGNESHASLSFCSALKFNLQCMFIRVYSGRILQFIFEANALNRSSCNFEYTFSFDDQ